MFGWLKKTFALTIGAVADEQRTRYNALMYADPQRVIDAITAFNCGDLGQLARIIEELELRDDKMRVCSKKLRASVARCKWVVEPRKGFEEDAEAKRHAEALSRFWSGITVTNRFARNERGGIRLLIKQLMEAESFGFAVDEIVWSILPSGELTAEFAKIPLWHFENKTGELRFLPRTTDYDGVELKEGEWLVATGDGVGIAATICATLKRCSLADWAVFCERCGMPFFIGKTGASFGSEQWNNMRDALEAIGREARILTDKSSEISAVQIGGSGKEPYSALVEWADRAISALYRGADLPTMSAEDSVGASVQARELVIIEEDACARLSETLHEQVERFVVKFMFKNAEPLAAIRIISETEGK